MASGSSSSEHPELLRLIAAVLTSDAGGPGFKGRLAIGVRDDGREEWLKIILDDRVQATFEAKRPEGMEATLLLGAADAAIIAESGELPEQPALLAASGDRQLLLLFFARYQPKASWAVAHPQKAKR